MLVFLCSIVFAQDIDPVMQAAESELMRSFQILQQQPEPAYWIGLGIHDIHNIDLRTSLTILILIVFMLLH